MFTKSYKSGWGGEGLALTKSKGDWLELARSWTAVAERSGDTAFVPEWPLGCDDGSRAHESGVAPAPAGFPPQSKITYGLRCCPGSDADLIH